MVTLSFDAFKRFHAHTPGACGRSGPAVAPEMDGDRGVHEMEGGVSDAVRRRSGRDSCSVGRATPVCIPGSKNEVPLAPSGGRWGVVWASMPRHRPLLLPGRLHEA